MTSIIILVLSTLVSMLAVNWIFLRMLRIAKAKGLVDNPNARKLQKKAVPVLGGIAVFFGLLFGMIAFCAMAKSQLQHELLSLTPVILGASILLYVGSLDDILGLTPGKRLVIEILVVLGLIWGTGMCIDSFHTLWGIQGFSWWYAVPLTVFGCVGIINAFNMVDGVNGLSSGLCIVVSVILSVIFWKRQDYADAALAACYAGALLPFWLHNVIGYYSKMFIGDGGTMVMGLLMSWFVIRIMSSSNPLMIFASNREMCLTAMVLALASVPVFDTLRVMSGRIIKGISPFTADKTHLHHAFIASGVSHLVTSLSEQAINVVVVVAWYVSYRLGMSVEMQLYITIAVAIILVWGTYGFLHFQEKYNTPLFRRFKKVSRVTNANMGNNAWWQRLQRFLDREAYKDMLVSFREKYIKKPEESSSKDRNAAAVLDYLKERELVLVDDMMSLVTSSRDGLCKILSEFEMDEIIFVEEYDENGAMKTVKITKVGLDFLNM